MAALVTYPSGVGFPGFESYSLKLAFMGTSLRSPFTGKRQTVNYPYSVWNFKGKYSQALGLNAGKLRSFLTQLNGQANMFFLPLPEYVAPSSGYSRNGNYFSQSNTFNNAAWSKSNLTFVDASATDPLGGSAASTCTAGASAGSGNNFLAQGCPSTIYNQLFTFSIWLKAGTYTGNVFVFIQDVTGAVYKVLITVTPTTAWQQFSVSLMVPQAATLPLQGTIVLATPASGQTLFVYNAQMNVGPAPTGGVITTTAPITDTGIVNGANQTGGSLVTSGWVANALIFNDGDYFTLVPTVGNPELKMVNGTVTANGSGAATINFSPPIRNSPANSAAIVINNPYVCLNSNEDDAANWDLTPPIMYGMELDCIECIE